LSANGSLQLGPDGFNIAGSASLDITYFDNNGKAFGGHRNFTLDVGGSVSVTGEIFYIPVGPLTLGIDYDSATGGISVLVGPVPVPEIALTEILGVWIPYPTVTMKNLSFEVGTLKAVKVQPPPPVLGQ